MKLDIPGGGHITIDDSSVQASDIKKGFGYSIDENGNLVVSKEKTNLDFSDLKTKFDAGTASNTEVQKFLSYLLDKEFS